MTESASTTQLSGAELDRAIAERVMGQVACDKWRHINFGRAGGPAMINEGCDHNGQCFPAETGPSHYSESIEAAMQAVEKMYAADWSVEIHRSVVIDDEWLVEFCTVTDGNAKKVIGISKTLPEAISRAALAAIEGS